MKHILLVFILINLSFGMAFSQCGCSNTFVSGATPLCDSTKLNWAKWTSVTSSLVTGTISSDINVSVTKSVNDLRSTGGMFNGGIFPTSYGVPVNSTAILNDLAGRVTICFNKPVRDPQIAIASIGTPGLLVQVNTSDCYRLVWQGVGMTYHNDTSMTGREGFTIIKFPGVHTCLSLDFLQNEYYCNLAVGVSDTNCQKTTPAPVCFALGNSAALFAGGAENYSWSPSIGLSADTGAVVTANPFNTTTYYVTGTGPNNCTSVDSIVVAVKPSPDLEITGDTMVCIGSQATLHAGTGYSQYSWRGGGSGETFTATQSGEYAVTVTNIEGCSGADSVKVYVVDPPFIDPLRDTTVCIGESARLSVSGTDIFSYRWTPSSGLTCDDCASPFVSPSATTTYVVQVNPGTNCTSFDTVLVEVDSVPAPVLMADKDIFCARDSARICAPPGFASYEWNTIETTPCIYAKQAGNYYVTVTNVNGCTAESNRQLISVYPVPSVSIVINDDSLSSFGAVSYQWYLDGNKIEGATSSGYSTTESGYYTLEITDQNGCSSMSSPVLISGIDEMGSEAVNIYPNPSSMNNVQLTMTNDFVGSSLEVFAANGRIVFHSVLSTPNTALELPVPAGVYFIRIHSERTSVVKRWVRL